MDELRPRNIESILRQIIQVMLIPVPEYDPGIIEDLEAWLNVLGWYHNSLHKAWELLGVNVVVGKGGSLISGKW